ncbi:hypothetical protein [Paraburkholderia sp. PGU19]|uniref:hypothetical protein n=1 Tax=Paraburkholderia sp. PGU19 TaxID=2735434 RepID=UPI001FB0E548|nr:hypothetical protein [Paraburkholderia sp. PGU19]
MPVGERANATVFDLDEAADAFIHEPDPRNEIALLQTIAIRGKATGRQVERFGQREQDGSKDLSFHCSTQDEASLQNDGIKL